MPSNHTENIQLKLKINGVEAFNTLKDLNAHVAASKNSLNKMDLKDPGYEQAARKLRQALDAQKAWREEIYATQKTAKSFFDDFKTNMSSLVGSFTLGTLVANGISSAISSIKAFVGASEAAFKESEQNQAQLAAVIQSTGGAAGRTQAQLNALSETLMQQTGIDDDLITKSEALLLTFTHIGDEIYDQTLPLILDMSKALGQDLQSSALQVGKALNDPIAGLSALKKVGVSFSEEQKNLIQQLQKTGDIAGAQKIILSELAKEFGGVAQAMSQTTSGALERFETRLGNIQENIGGFITAMKAASATALEPFVRLLERWTGTAVSEKMAEEKRSLSMLRIELESANTSADRRLKIIQELQKKYPSHLKNLDAENAGNAELLPILSQINAEFVLRIAHQQRAEKLEEAVRAEADLMNASFEKKQTLIAKIAEIEEKLATDGIKFSIEGRTEQERAAYIQQKLVSTLRDQGEYLKSISYASMVAGLSGAEIGMGRLNSKLKEQQDIRKGMEADLQKFKESHPIEEPTTEQEKKPIGTEKTFETSNNSMSVAKESLKEFEKLGQEYEKLRVDQLQKSLSTNEKEIAQERAKFASLIAEREGFLKTKSIDPEQKVVISAQIDQLKTDQTASMHAIEIRQEEERIAQITALRAGFETVKEREVEKEIALINQKYARLKAEAGNNAQAVALLESQQTQDLSAAKIREAQRFQEEKQRLQAADLQHSGSQLDQELAKTEAKYAAEIAALKAKYSQELQLSQDFQDMLATIEGQRIHEIQELQAKNEALEDQKQRERKAATLQITQELAQATFSIMASNRQAESQSRLEELNTQREAELDNAALTEAERKKIQQKYAALISAEKLRAWQADKEASLAQAVINGALAVVKALPNVPLAIATGIASAAQLAVMAAQKPPKFARGGFVPAGPSHAAGGIALIDPKGKKVGEMEGGEPILSRATYANNRQLIDTLLYSSQRANGAKISLNMPQVIANHRFFAQGGLAPSLANSGTVADSKIDFSVLIVEIRELRAAVLVEKARPVSFNYRVFEEHRERILGIREGVEG